MSKSHRAMRRSVSYALLAAVMPAAYAADQTTPGTATDTSALTQVLVIGQAPAARDGHRHRQGARQRTDPLGR